jgi:hypothetical protein
MYTPIRQITDRPMKECKIAKNAKKCKFEIRTARKTNRTPQMSALWYRKVTEQVNQIIKRCKFVQNVKNKKASTIIIQNDANLEAPPPVNVGFTTRKIQAYHDDTATFEQPKP